MHFTSLLYIPFSAYATYHYWPAHLLSSVLNCFRGRFRAGGSWSAKSVLTVASLIYIPRSRNAVCTLSENRTRHPGLRGRWLNRLPHRAFESFKRHTHNGCLRVVTFLWLIAHNTMVPRPRVELGTLAWRANGLNRLPHGAYGGFACSANTEHSILLPLYKKKRLLKDSNLRHSD